MNREMSNGFVAERLVHVALGSNLGDSKALIRQALGRIEAWARQFRPDTSFRVSRFYKSPSLGAAGPDYINAVAEFASLLEGEYILRALQGIELEFGRLRPYPNAPRTLDLDILLIGDEQIRSAILTVPHPRMHGRAFVLKPLADLQPDLVLAGVPIKELLRQCEDQACVPVSDA